MLNQNFNSSLLIYVVYFLFSWIRKNRFRRIFLILNMSRPTKNSRELVIEFSWYFKRSQASRNFARALLFTRGNSTSIIYFWIILYFKIRFSGLELNVLRSRNAIYISIIATPKKSDFIIFAIQNFVQNTKKHT